MSENDNLNSAAPINMTAGIIGAVIGALVGSIAWIVIGSLGYVSCWIAFLMIYLAMTLYKKMGGGIDKKGKIISGVISMLMVFPASFSVLCIQITKYLNEDAGISFKFSSVVQVVLQDMVSSESQFRGSFILLLFQGYLFAGLGVFLFVRNKKRTDDIARNAGKFTTLHADKKTMAKKYITAIASIVIGLVLFMVCMDKDHVALGLIFFVAGFIAFFVFIIRSQIPFIFMNQNGFSYNDGKGHKSKDEIGWFSITSVQAPLGDGLCRISTRDMKTHLIDGSQIPRFGEFWDRANRSVSGVPADSTAADSVTSESAAAEVMTADVTPAESMTTVVTPAGSVTPDAPTDTEI